MSGAPFSTGEHVIVACGGPWEHLRGYRLEVAACVRSRTFAGGWALMLRGDADLVVPERLVSVQGVRRAEALFIDRESQSLAATTRAIATGEGRIRRHEFAYALAFVALIAAFKGMRAAAVVSKKRAKRHAFRVASILERLQRMGMMPVAVEVAVRRGLEVSEIVGSRRIACIAKARQELCYELRERGLSASDVGRLLELDHTTVSYATRRHRERLEAAHESQTDVAARVSSVHGPPGPRVDASGA